eukprot:gnl/TRDRNA2_/TRDRNA2_167783_c0_seq1.p1 gnl/TRDRNA2_/TRDRNA2_167783_c0~~gnl/TRDRNA2_/TRDRNA2_167783_c0_seq1.p1  ORF type:complete len:124 (+),score=21.76 gnl/TRDRNA2_/TRDRNA2_167783_c0_seq1:87-458(+)
MAKLLNLTLILAVVGIAFVLQGCEDKPNPGCDATRRSQIEGCQMSAIGRVKAEWQMCSSINMIVACYGACCTANAKNPDGTDMVDEETGAVVTLASQMEAAVAPFAQQSGCEVPACSDDRGWD